MANQFQNINKKRKKSFKSIIIITVILFIVVLAGLLFLFDFGGVRAKVTAVFSKSTGSDVLSEEKIKIQKEWQNIENEKARLKLIEDELNNLRYRLENKQQGIGTEGY